MYTPEDKQLARQLVQDEKYMELIAKVFLDEEDKLNEETMKKPNNELGEIVRANMLAEYKVKTRYAKLKQLAQDTGNKPNPGPKA